jgi:hypothetical protein
VILHKIKGLVERHQLEESGDRASLMNIMTAKGFSSVAISATVCINLGLPNILQWLLSIVTGEKRIDT